MSRRPSIVREMRRARARWLRAWKVYLWPYMLIAIIVLTLIVYALLTSRNAPR